MTTTATCHCGTVQIALTGAPILSNECCCTSCRAANHGFEALPGAGQVVHDTGGTPYTLIRKDRVRLERGGDRLVAHYLKPGAPTRRVTAACCNAPMYLEFKAGHWLSIYTDRIPPENRLPVELYTMAGDLPDRANLPPGIPAPKTHTPRFMAKLLGAWVAMGFRVPKIDWVKERANG